MNSLISFLIATYNAGAWIAETIQSTLVQTWPSSDDSDVRKSISRTDGMKTGAVWSAASSSS